MALCCCCCCCSIKGSRLVEREREKERERDQLGKEKGYQAERTRWPLVAVNVTSYVQQCSAVVSKVYLIFSDFCLALLSFAVCVCVFVSTPFFVLFPFFFTTRYHPAHADMVRPGMALPGLATLVIINARLSFPRFFPRLSLFFFSKLLLTALSFFTTRRHL